MVASPSIALDLPLKALAWEDAQGKVWLSYNVPEYLKERHGLRDDLLKNISGVGGPDRGCGWIIKKPSPEGNWAVAGGVRRLFSPFILTAAPAWEG
jgi:hypothetical protein